MSGSEVVLYLGQHSDPISVATVQKFSGWVMLAFLPYDSGLLAAENPRWL
jgi:hypothetical protein